MEGTELVAQTAEIMPIDGDSLVSLANRAEQRIDAMLKIKGLALRMTNIHDWTDQGGKPYLQVSGSEKVARLFGISWRLSEPVYQLEENGHFTFTYKGEFSLGGATIEAIGVRSSKDGFFNSRNDYSVRDENGKPKKIELPPAEIDKGDVKKAAYTNCLGNGITRILGLRNLTWDDLKSSGITQDAIKGAGRGVSYKTTPKQQGASEGDGRESAASGPQINAITALLNQNEGITDKAKQCERVSFLLGLQPDQVISEISPKTLTKSQASTVITSLKGGA